MKWMQFRLRSLFVLLTLVGVFLWWLRPDTLTVNDGIFLFHCKPRGCVNCCAYDWSAVKPKSYVLFQLWPKGFRYPFAIASEPNRITIQFPHGEPNE